MTNAGTLILGYGITVGVVAGYALWLWRRARRLGAELGISQPDGPGTAAGDANAGVERNDHTG